MGSEEKNTEGGRFFEEWENPPEDTFEDDAGDEWSEQTGAPAGDAPEGTRDDEWEEPEEVPAEARRPAGLSATELVQLQQRFKGGANWFFWIAGLSMINTVLILTEKGWSFVVGLGVTQIIDYIAREVVTEGDAPRAIAFGVALFFDLIAAGFCVLFGILCRYRQIWAFWVGMVLYFLDGMILFAFSMWFAFGFHIFVLYGIYLGLRAAKQLKDLGIQDQTPSPA